MIEVQAVLLNAFGSHGVAVNHPIDPVGDQSEPAILRSGGPAHVVPHCWSQAERSGGTRRRGPSC